MKKISILMAIAAVLFFAGCEKSDEEQTHNTQNQENHVQNQEQPLIVGEWEVVSSEYKYVNGIPGPTFYDLASYYQEKEMAQIGTTWKFKENGVFECSTGTLELYTVDDSVKVLTISHYAPFNIMTLTTDTLSIMHGVRFAHWRKDEAGDWLVKICLARK